jgi:Tol biopolymer transport system component
MNCQDRPTFSPDGADLLFRCQPKGEDGPSNLYLVHPDGSRLHQITFAPSDRQFLGTSFSPGYRRGTGWIAAGRSGGYGDDGNADVFLLRMEGGKLVRMVNLTRSEPWDSAPGWGAAAG